MSMQSHENDLLISPESHQAPTKRTDAAESAGPEALMHGRTDVLTPSAVMHLQKTAGNASVSAALEEQETSPVRDVVGSGGGALLDRDTRGFMESRLGADFSDVRVHTDAKATESARSVQAHAYTVGNDVVFQSDKYAPQSDSGQRMLAHELTHVVQQRSGPVAGTPAPGGIQISHPSDSFERAAEASADRVMSSATPSVESHAAAAPAAVQRAEADTGDEVDEDPKLQTYAIQRQESDEFAPEGDE
jgi:hypothetical protein